MAFEIIDDEMTDILWNLTDRHEAEEYYEMENDCAEDMAQQM